MMEGRVMEASMRLAKVVPALPMLALIFVCAIGAVGCERSPQQSAAPAETVSPPTVPPAGGDPFALSKPSPAPGSDRFDPDDHPELAHLTEVTTESLARGIQSYVESESARQGGVFPVDDPEQQTSLGLTLTTVHRERLSQLADGRYFACADFKGRDGHSYDVDVFMQARSTGGVVPTDVIVHKQDGKARFNWVEQGGKWIQAPVAAP